jgi:hypothetical protein
VADLCEHGYAPDQCTICRALRTGTTTAPGRSAPGYQQAGPPATRESWSHWGSAAPQPAGRGPERRSIGTHVALVVVGIIAIVAVAWLLAGAVFAILHLLELVVVAGVAGWAGYRLGHYRGRNQRG